MNVTIVGAGLAGSWLAWWLVQEGCSVHVVDTLNPSSSSHVAAGLINPITGPRYQGTWQGASLLPWMAKAYASVELATGVNAIKHTRLRRVIRDEASMQRVQQRVLDKEYHWMDLQVIPAGTRDGIPLPYGAVDVAAYIVNTTAFLEATWNWLRENGRVNRTQVENPLVPPSDVTVWCTGWHAATDERWSWLPFAPVRGDILDVHIPGISIDYVLTGGVWVVPQGDNHYRLGSTYDWDRLDTVAYPDMREKLLQLAHEMLGTADIAVVNHRVGIRPAVLPRRPVAGRHPTEACHYILNGLGTKGASLAPWVAKQLARNLVHGEALHSEIDIQQYWKYHV